MLQPGQALQQRLENTTGLAYLLALRALGGRQLVLELTELPLVALRLPRLLLALACLQPDVAKSVRLL